MLVHTEMGLRPENISRQKCHLQPVGAPNPKGPHSSAGIGVCGWAASLPPTGNPSFPLSFWGALGLTARAQKGALNTHLALLSTLWQGSELPFLSLAVVKKNPLGSQ